MGKGDTHLPVSGTPPSSPTRQGSSTRQGNREGKGSDVKEQKEEDFGLAPLEEEIESKRKEPSKEPAGDTILSTSEASDTSPEGPLKSLIEEQLEAGRLGEEEEKFVRRRNADFNPLYPPGYERPRTGVSPWLFVGLGIGVCLLIGLVLWIVSSS